MIIKHSVFSVADNSGATKVKCIHAGGFHGKSVASFGSVIVVSIKSCMPGGKVKKGEVHKAIIVRLKKRKSLNNGMVVSFDDNAVVLIDKNHEPIGTRVIGPVSRYVKNVSVKIASLASEVF